MPQMLMPKLHALKDDFIVFGKPDISGMEKLAVCQVLDSGWLSTGSWVTLFEKEFEDYMGGGYAVATSSCTSALTLSLLTAGVKPGDGVLVPTMTFCATVNAILNIGAKPIFIESTENGLMDLNMIPDAIRLSLNKVKAIVPVDYLGIPFPIDKIEGIRGQYGFEVIEDAAHGFGGTYKGKTIGSLANFSCFSFYPTKNITSGEGGMVWTKDEEKSAMVRSLSNHGMTRNAWNRYGKEVLAHYDVYLTGQKANMSDIHAAIGFTQMKRWPEIKERRDIIWNVYAEAFGEKEEGHSRHLYTILHPKRYELRQYLFDNGVGTGIQFKPLHLERAYAHLGYHDDDFPIAEKIGRETLSLPISGTMTKHDAERVVKLIYDFD